MLIVRHAATILFVLALGLSLTPQVLADNSFNGVVYALHYNLDEGWVEARLFPSSGGPDVIATTSDDRAVAVLASAMARGEVVTIYVDDATPNTITGVEWNRPRVKDHIGCQ